MIFVGVMGVGKPAATKERVAQKRTAEGPQSCKSLDFVIRILALTKSIDRLPLFPGSHCSECVAVNALCNCSEFVSFFETASTGARRPVSCYLSGTPQRFCLACSITWAHHGLVLSSLSWYSEPFQS